MVEKRFIENLLPLEFCYSMLSYNSITATIVPGDLTLQFIL
ncbi:hypothetical protein TRIP_C21058 [Candidatus Zixiibacteriota bacterium]|nr:hypothetical protein TRIP_C21058 [candidate division Zixibacteria bacterium]